MPAYNAQNTLLETYSNIPKGLADEIILVDDCSSDSTVEIAKRLGIKTFVHEKNLGYGANQKTCYKKALEENADIVIMLHPDFQYDPKLIPALASMIAYENYDFVIASRFLLDSAKYSKMPKYKYFANRFLTFIQNLCFGRNLSEYHSGYRIFSRKILENIDFDYFDNGFIFDNQMLASICYKNLSIGEISCPAKYFDSASSINFLASVKYGFGVLNISLLFVLAKLNLFRGNIFK